MMRLEPPGSSMSEWEYDDFPTMLYLTTVSC